VELIDQVAMLRSTLTEARQENKTLRRELASRPTSWAYEQACKALHHWRAEAKRLGHIAGEEPEEMRNSGSNQ
ncbi:MAG: hypothetical protein ABL893_11180, partial [Hyphomicrobium sp.]